MALSAAWMARSAVSHFGSSPAVRNVNWPAGTGLAAASSGRPDGSIAPGARPSSRPSSRSSITAQPAAACPRSARPRRSVFRYVGLSWCRTSLMLPYETPPKPHGLSGYSVSTERCPGEQRGPALASRAGCSTTPNPFSTLADDGFGAYRIGGGSAVQRTSGRFSNPRIQNEESQ